MRRMKLSRIGAGTTLATVILTAWLGACSTNSNESCGNAGNWNGTCEQGTTCPTGMVEINVTESPATSCPGTNAAGGSYICCGPKTDGATTTPAADTGATTPTADSGATKG